jgi:hypothetical protein
LKRMIRLILLIQCPNRPESYFQSFERPDDTLPTVNFLFFLK